MEKDRRLYVGLTSGFSLRIFFYIYPSWALYIWAMKAIWYRQLRQQARDGGQYPAVSYRLFWSGFISPSYCLPVPYSRVLEHTQMATLASWFLMGSQPIYIFWIFYPFLCFCVFFFLFSLFVHNFNRFFQYNQRGMSNTMRPRGKVRFHLVYDRG